MINDNEDDMPIQTSFSLITVTQRCRRRWARSGCGHCPECPGSAAGGGGGHSSLLLLFSCSLLCLSSSLLIISSNLLFSCSFLSISLLRRSFSSLSLLVSSTKLTIFSVFGCESSPISRNVRSSGRACVRACVSRQMQSKAY